MWQGSRLEDNLVFVLLPTHMFPRTTLRPWDLTVNTFPHRALLLAYHIGFNVYVIVCLCLCLCVWHTHIYMLFFILFLLNSINLKLWKQQFTNEMNFLLSYIFYSSINCLQSNEGHGDGKAAHKLRAFVAFAENPGSIPSSHMVVHNPL